MSVVLMSKRELNRIDVLARLESGRLTPGAAAALLRVSERQVYRLMRRFREGGPAAIADRRRGRPSKQSPAGCPAQPGRRPGAPALCGFRPNPGCREARRPPRCAGLSRDAAQLDDPGRGLAAAGRTQALSPAAPTRGKRQNFATCVDARFGARRIFWIGAARGRVLTCVRPLMRLTRRRPGWEFADQVQFSPTRLKRLSQSWFSRSRLSDRCAIPLLRPSHAPTAQQPRALMRSWPEPGNSHP